MSLICVHCRLLYGTRLYSFRLPVFSHQISCETLDQATGRRIILGTLDNWDVYVVRKLVKDCIM